MKRNILLLVFVLICTIIFQTCNLYDQCNPKKLGDASFTSTDLAIVPYDGTQTIVFKSSTGDSVSYYPSTQGWYNIGKDLQWFYSDECSDYYDYEIKYMMLLSTNDSSSGIGFTLRTLNPFYYDHDKSLEISLRYSDSIYTGGKYFFDKVNDIFDSSTPEELFAYNSILTLGPNTYNSVYTLTNIKDLANPKIFYFSVSEGVVGFITVNGILWYLDK